jgi:hypothetical protein
MMPPFYILKITPQDLALVGKALGNRPYIEVAALLIELQGQITAQEQVLQESGSKEGPVKEPEANQ